MVVLEVLHGMSLISLPGIPLQLTQSVIPIGATPRTLGRGLAGALKWLTAEPLTWSVSAWLVVLPGTRDTRARRLLTRREGNTLPGA